MSHPNPGTCEYVSLHGEKNFGDMIQLRILRWEDGWVQHNHNGRESQVGLKEEI